MGLSKMIAYKWVKLALYLTIIISTILLFNYVLFPHEAPSSPKAGNFCLIYWFPAWCMVHLRQILNVFVTRRSVPRYIHQGFFSSSFMLTAIQLNHAQKKNKGIFGFCIWNLHRASSLVGSRNLTNVLRNPPSSFFCVGFILRQALLILWQRQISIIPCSYLYSL